jgi:outer membrane biosynthesis protein TonB
VEAYVISLGLWAVLAVGSPSNAPQSSSSSAKPTPGIEVVFDSAEEAPPPPTPQGDERRVIGDFIRDHSADIRDCYARRLQESPTLRGKLVARFDIGPTGKVIGATADGIADRQLQLCVVHVVRGWEFSAPANGAKLRVAYPFKFEPQPSR